MNEHIEIEFKNMLTLSEFNFLKNHFQLKDSHFIKQINYYFDTAHFALAKRKTALRIREKNNAFELTMKQPHDEGVLETNISLQKKEAEAFIFENQFPSSATQMKSIFQKICVKPTELLCLGELTTFRSEFSYKEGLIALDYNCYLGIEDYELEYEVIDKQTGKHYFEELLHKLNIKVKRTDNKIKRFFTEKEKQIVV